VTPVPSRERSALELTDDGLLGVVVRLELAVTQALEGITAGLGLSLGDYLVLGVIRRSPGGRSAPTAICDVLGRTTGGMTLTLDRLEAAGWLRRSPDPTDRRRVVVELTRSGREVATRANDSLHAWERDLDLPGEPRVILDSVEVLTAAIRTSSEHGGAGGSTTR
jgi:DNA-binding MarR family transcriptional regulator